MTPHLFNARLTGVFVAVSCLAFGITPTAKQQTSSSTTSTFNVVEATIDDVRAALTARQISCRELTELYVERIRAYNQTGPSLNSVQTVNPKALQEADRLDRA